MQNDGQTITYPATQSKQKWGERGDAAGKPDHWAMLPF